MIPSFNCIDDTIVATNKSTRYCLSSAINHIGRSIEAGHYTYTVRNPCTGQWLKFNDDKVGIVLNINKKEVTFSCKITHLKKPLPYVNF
jgi:uncharacterized UBP type Zn finger protein